jgi:hypothetical protein
MNRTVMSPTLYRNKKGEREECSCPSAAVCVRRGLEANPTPTDAEISITRKREEERREKVTRIFGADAFYYTREPTRFLLRQQTMAICCAGEKKVLSICYV